MFKKRHPVDSDTIVDRFVKNFAIIIFLFSICRDRYRDVLAASDAITSMKDISEEIVTNIRNATEKCTEVLGWAPDNRNKFPFEKNL